MYFKPVFWERAQNKVSIHNNAQITCDFDAFVLDKAKTLRNGGEIQKIIIRNGLHEGIRDKYGSIYTDNDEAYVIEITQTLTIYSQTKRGALYALSTLSAMIESDEMTQSLLFDYPACPVRGYRAFIPGVANMTQFKQTLDFMAEYKYNTLMLEIGGAMAYKRRPEINRHWVEYCKELTKVSDRTHDIQHRTYPWHKNSIHVDNGFGTFMTQEEMKEIIKYCDDRCIEIIPEVPSLSHCDYLVGTYPEINERADDKHPDTYCPSNPKSYEILFDILDEITDVFKPRYINIGHDELYTIAICPLCKEKDPVDLFVRDINKINTYLAGKGVKTILWCEKLFEKESLDGDPAGGGAYKSPGDIAYVPPLIECLGKISKDVIMLHWYWRYLNYDQEKRVIDHGYQMYLGNFSALHMQDFRKRMNLGISGAFVSNWGSYQPEYMQRNHQYLDLMTTAYALWSREYDTPQREELLERAKTVLYRFIHKDIQGKTQLKVLHTTNYYTPYEVFYDGVFIVDDRYILGYYVVTYDDNTTAKLPVKYGFNISNNKLEESFNSSYMEVLGGTMPFRSGGETYYETVYENPYPEKEIRHISFVKSLNKDFEVVTKSLTGSDKTAVRQPVTV
jgi:hexosaminidase